MVEKIKCIGRKVGVDLLTYLESAGQSQIQIEQAGIAGFQKF